MIKCLKYTPAKNDTEFKNSNADHLIAPIGHVQEVGLLGDGNFQEISKTPLVAHVLKLGMKNFRGFHQHIQMILNKLGPISLMDLLWNTRNLRIP